MQAYLYLQDAKYAVLLHADLGSKTVRQHVQEIADFLSIPLENRRDLILLPDQRRQSGTETE